MPDPDIEEILAALVAALDLLPEEDALAIVDEFPDACLRAAAAADRPRFGLGGQLWSSWEATALDQG